MNNSFWSVKNRDNIVAILRAPATAYLVQIVCDDLSVFVIKCKYYEVWNNKPSEQITICQWAVDEGNYFQPDSVNISEKVINFDQSIFSGRVFNCNEIPDVFVWNIQFIPNICMPNFL